MKFVVKCFEIILNILPMPLCYFCCFRPIFSEVLLLWVFDIAYPKLFLFFVLKY